MRVWSAAIALIAGLAVVGGAGSAATNFNVNGFDISAVEGIKWSGTVAHFTDPDAPTDATFTASIDWGDNTSGTGSVVRTALHEYDVNAEHNFVDEGTYQLDIRISGSTGSGRTAPKAVVVDAPLTLTMGVPTGITAGGTVNGKVATFTDGNSDEVPGAFKATIDWGDGSTSAGAVAKTGPGAFSVSGAHTFGEEGQSNVKVTVNDVGGSTASGTQAVTIGDAPLTAGAPFTVRSREGKAYTGVVATFRDADADAPASDYTTVSINWGDGRFSSGTVTPAAGGGWQVRGSHTYAEEGIFKTSVLVKDKGGSTATIPGFAAIGDAPLYPRARVLTAHAGVRFTGVVATFTDGAPRAPLRDYTVSISWGDGKTSAGSVRKVAGHVSVFGTHTYATPGRKEVTVRIRDRGGSRATAYSPMRVLG
jgi:hypothetical protein